MADKDDQEKAERVVKDILADKLSKDIKDIKIESILKDDLGMDSFRAVELIFELKDKFGTEIPQEDFSKIKTVKDIIEYIKKNDK